MYWIADGFHQSFRFSCLRTTNFSSAVAKKFSNTGSQVSHVGHLIEGAAVTEPDFAIKSQYKQNIIECTSVPQHFIYSLGMIWVAWWQ